MPDAALPRLQEADNLVSAMQGEVRDISLRLGQSMLDDLGLRPVLQWLKERTEAVTDMEVRVDFHAGTDRFPPALKLTAFRIAQEALTNAVRHAQATLVLIEVKDAATAREIVVADNVLVLKLASSIRQTRATAWFG